GSRRGQQLKDRDREENLGQHSPGLAGCRFERQMADWCSRPTSYKMLRHMNPVVSDKPYVPVPPYRGTLWPRALNLYFPRYLRRHYGTAKIEIVGADKLRASIAAGHGILITPNHCRDEDPFILSALASNVGQPFF